MAGTGGVVEDAIAAFGESATTSLLQGWTLSRTDPTWKESSMQPGIVGAAHRMAAHGLVTSAAGRARLTRICREALDSPGHWSTLISAIDLALSLNDQPLVDSVVALRGGRPALAARGITSPEDADRVLKHLQTVIGR